MELKDKPVFKDTTFISKNHTPSVSDALNALLHLGYNYTQAQKALKKATMENPEENDTGKLISLALKNL